MSRERDVRIGCAMGVYGDLFCEAGGKREAGLHNRHPSAAKHETATNSQSLFLGIADGHPRVTAWLD